MPKGWFARRWRALAGVVLCLGAVGIYAPRVGADNASGCDFAPNGSTASCTGPLSGSTFAGGDGNLSASPTTYGTTDWQNVAGLSSGFDLASGLRSLMRQHLCFLQFFRPIRNEHTMR